MFITYSHFKVFQGLQILKKKSPHVILFSGIVISGFSNFLTSIPIDLDIIFTIQTIPIIIGLLLTAYGWNLIPSFEELFWYQKLHTLLVFRQKDSLILYRFSFFQSTNNSVENDIQNQKSNENDLDNVLASGYLSGIQIVLSNMLKNKGDLRQIEIGNKTLFFEHINDLTFVLITSNAIEELILRLQHFGADFLKQFPLSEQGPVIEVSKYQSAERLIEKHFKPSIL
jgi:hypothetical protein